MLSTHQSDHLFDRFTALVAGLYLLLTLGMTWPVVAELGEIAGEGVDLYSHLWTFHWIRDALLGGQNPFFTERIFYPTGVSLANHNVAWLQILLWIPLQALFGDVSGYNILMLLVIAFNGLAMYLLAQDLMENRPAAFISGLIFAFWPYTITQNDHPNMMFVAWAPLAVLFLRRALTGSRRRDMLLAALCLALIGWVRLQLMVMAAIPIGLFVLALLWPQTRQERKRSLGQLLLIGAITAGLILPITLPVAVHQLTRDNPEDLYLDEQDEKQTDLLAYISPTQQHPLWESTLEPIYGRFHQNFDIQNRLRTPYLGYSVLLLALLGAIATAPRSRAWTMMAVVLILFALGPILRVNGQLLPQIPMPYRLVADNPLMRLLRQTDRINVLLGLPVGILAGFGMVVVRRWVKRPSRYLLLASVFALLILGEYASFPFPQSSADVPDWLAARRDDPDDYAIVHLPNHLYGHNKYYMYYQTVHGKPLANGKVARVPREALAYWESVPLLDGLQDVEAIQIDRPDVSRQLQLLHDAGFRYLIIHKNLSEGRQVVIWRDWFTIEPLYEDEDLIVYTTAPQAGKDFGFNQMLSSSVGLIRGEINLDTAVPGGALKTTLRLGSTAPPGQALQACLQLGAGEDVVHQACDLITPDWNTAVWPANAVSREGRNLWIDETIPPGDYTLRLQLADGNGNFLGETVVLGPVRVDPYAPTAAADVVWGDVIGLPDYRLEQGDDALQLTLYWQAERKMTAQYKFFVHLLDPDSGEIAAQVDAAPRHWTYPTFAWEPGERVHDKVTLSLADVASGRYHLVAGWYNEETGERLLVNSPGGSQTTETTARLTIVTVP